MEHDIATILLAREREQRERAKKQRESKERVKKQRG
jgi:hypothetical protein